MKAIMFLLLLLTVTGVVCAVTLEKVFNEGILNVKYYDSYDKNTPKTYKEIHSHASFVVNVFSPQLCKLNREESSSFSGGDLKALNCAKRMSKHRDFILLKFTFYATCDKYSAVYKDTSFYNLQFSDFEDANLTIDSKVYHPTSIKPVYFETVFSAKENAKDYSNLAITNLYIMLEFPFVAFYEFESGKSFKLDFEYRNGLDYYEREIEYSSFLEYCVKSANYY